jgi:hypothetical protein
MKPSLVMSVWLILALFLPLLRTNAWQDDFSIVAIDHENKIIFGSESELREKLNEII